MPERYDAVVIEDSETLTNDGGTPRKFFTNVGAAFPTRNGGAITVLIRQGLGVHGELVLFPPSPRAACASAPRRSRGSSTGNRA